MKRTYVAQIIRINHEDRIAYLNIDLGFRLWRLQSVSLNNLREWDKYKNTDWINVNIYQEKDPISTLQAVYTYDAIVVSKAQEPRTVPV